MEENNRFRSDFYYELAAHKEYNQLLSDGMGRTTFLNSITVLSMLYLMTQLDNSLILSLTLGFEGFLLFSNIFRRIRNKDGGITYKQILHSNDDSIPHQIVTFGEEGIRSRVPRTGKEMQDSYDSIRYLIESENLLVLLTELKLCHIVDKRYLSGGTREELIAFLREKCPKLKKRIKTGRLGHIVNTALRITVAVGFILALAVAFRIPQRINGRLDNRMRYADMAEELKPIGITISEQTILELEAYDEEYALEFGEYYTDNPGASKICDLLYWEGCGIYDEETWEWTPSQSGIYWFDLEVFNLSSIYTDFLRGVDALSEDLTFSNISEDYTAVDIEGGSGIILVSFDYEGQSYQLDAQYYYDWFDLGMLRNLSRILSTDGKAENLWYAEDVQALYLYYGTTTQVKTLENLSGLNFFSCEMIGLLG